jgi:predicted amidohydrolase YtcJ
MSATGDLLLLNGRVLTMDPAQPVASAVAIRMGRVVYAGDDAGAKAHASPGSEVIDLAGRTTTPGLNDAHAHPMMVGYALRDLDLSPDRHASITDLQGLVREAAAATPARTWMPLRRIIPSCCCASVITSARSTRRRCGSPG